MGAPGRKVAQGEVRGGRVARGDEGEVGELGHLHVHHGRLLESAVAARDLNSSAPVFSYGGGVCIGVRECGCGFSVIYVCICPCVCATWECAWG